MKRNTYKLLPLLAALALLLSLLAGCAGGEADAPPPDEPAPSEETSRPEADPAPQPPEEPEPQQPDQNEDSEALPVQAEEPAPEAEAQPEPEPQPVPEPEPEPEPEPAAPVPEDGDYTAAVTLSGGSGRAAVSSPAALRCEDGTFRATIVWSSPNFDYMKVDGERYDPVSEPGSNSAFEIPVAAFDTPLAVVADTVAMSEPHEVEYTLTFDSATLTKQ